MGAHFYNSFPEDGKILKAKLFIKMLHEKHVSLRPEHSQMFSVLIAILTTKVNSSKGYLPAHFKSINHISVAIWEFKSPDNFENLTHRVPLAFNTGFTNTTPEYFL